MFKIKILCLILCMLLFMPSVYCENEEISHNEPSSYVSVRVPIIMYHRMSKSCSDRDRFVITPEEFERDLKFLKNNGYETIQMKDLIAFVNDGNPLPEKPVILTFDDGYYSDYKYLHPILKQYQMKAVVSIIGYLTDKYSAESRTDINYPHLTWNQIKEITSDGVIEIQNHTYNMHGTNGSAKLSKENKEQYQIRFKSDVGKWQARIGEMLDGYMPTTFTYPLGKISKDSYDAVREMGFSASLSCDEGMNEVIQGDSESLFRLKRYIRPCCRSAGSILK